MSLMLSSVGNDLGQDLSSEWSEGGTSETV